MRIRESFIETSTWHVEGFEEIKPQNPYSKFINLLLFMVDIQMKKYYNCIWYNILVFNSIL